MATLSLALLGPFNALLDSEPAPSLRTNKAQALLVFLAAEQTQSPGTSQRRERIMELLWPDMPAGSARQNLRQTLYLLRKDLAEVDGKNGSMVPLLHSDRQVIQFNPESQIDIDITRFQQHISAGTTKDLQAAADLYRGDFLADFYLPDSNEFEDWAANLRGIFRNQAIDLFETLWSRHIRRTRYDLAEKAARRQLEIDQLLESAHRQLIEALARGGQQSLALAQYDICRDLLQNELGIEPSLETQQLMVAVRDGQLKAIGSPFAVRGYELRETIGEGGFGIVYRAVQSAVGREVAIKAIRRRFADNPDFIRRFEAEAHLVARLESPHIVPLYDFWREPGGAFLVMRWMRGGSLSESIKKGAWSPEKAVKLVDQIANALEMAHRQGIVHRDLKPGNILLDEAGNAYITDFGIAKDLTADQSFTNEGDFLGSPYYVTPEQLLNEPISPQTDIYSFGLTLYYLLAGEKPFGNGSPAIIIQKQINDPVPSTLIQQPDLPPTVDDVIQKATVKDPTQRYATVSEMAAAFRAAILGQPEQQPITPMVKKNVANPYKGLRPFEEADAGRFFGRQELITQLLAHLKDYRLLALVGPSGSGKSSVVKAGLIPALRRGEIQGSDNWFIAEMIPGTHPMEELEAALFRVAVNPPPTLLPLLREDERGLARAVKRILPRGNGEMLMLVDQFEELFTLVEDEDRRKFFLNSLAATASDLRGHVHIVLTLRADFYDRPLMYQEFGQLMRDYTQVIIPPTKADLAEAIRQPAAQSGIEVEDALVTRMIADVYERPGALPLLQYALTELFERRQYDLMTLADYESIAGVSGALANRAETLYQELDENGQAAAQQLFLRLVTLGEGIEDTRRRVLRDELKTVRLSSENLSHDEMMGLTNEIIDQYGRYRLLTFDNDPATRAPTVEVAHEALLNAWPRFRDWIAINRDGLRQQRRLSRWAAEWEDADRDPGLLLRESRLDQMAGWMAETELALSDSESEYLDASIQARRDRIAAEEARLQRELETARQLADEEQARANEQAEAARGLRRRAGYLTAALVVAGILALAAIFLGVQASANEQLAQNNAATAVAESAQRATAQAGAEFQQKETEQQRKLASSREIAAVARTTKNIDPELGVLLSLEALAVAYTQGAENALHEMLLASATELLLEGHTTDANVSEYSPDGTQLITSSWDNTTKLWDTKSGEQLLDLKFHSKPVRGAAFSPDGSMIATASEDSFVVIWDHLTGGRLSVLRGHSGIVGDVAFSPDGLRLASVGLDGSVIVWDMITEEILASMTQSEGLYASVIYSPNGEHLVTNGGDEFVHIWDAQSGEERTKLSLESEILGLSISPDSTLLAIEFQNSMVQVFTMIDEEDRLVIEKFGELEGFRRTETIDLPSHNFSPDGAQIVGIGQDRSIITWNVQTGTIEKKAYCHPLAITMTTSPDGTRAAVSGLDGSIRICRIEPAFEWITIKSPQIASVYNSVFSSDGQRLYTTSFDRSIGDGTIKGWDMTSPGVKSMNDELLVSEGLDLSGLGGTVYDVALSADGNKLAASGLGTARIWDIHSGDVVATFEVHNPTAAVWAIDISPDGTRLATASGNEDPFNPEGTATVWDISTGEPLSSLKGHVSWITDINFSPDGSKLVTASRDWSAIIWDAKSGTRLMNFDHDEALWSAIFSPDGRYLVTSTNEGLIHIWDITTGKDSGENAEPMQLVGHSGVATGLHFSPDSSKIASAGLDGTTRIWEVKSGQQILSLPANSNPVWSVTFSPDGKRLATTGTDGAVRVYILDLDELIEVARSRVTRSLTTAECKQYLHLDNCPNHLTSND